MKVRWLQAFLLLASLSLFAGFYCTPSTTPGYGGSEVVGVMVSSPSGTAVPNASAYACRQNGNSLDTIQKTFTATDGSFKFTNLEGGTYRLVGVLLTRDGSQDSLTGEKKDFLVADPAPKSQPTVTVNAGTITLLPPGFIAGRVVIDESDSSGVDCSILGTSFGAKTDHDGTFTISWVPAGKWVVAFTYDGYSRIYSDSITVTSGDTAKITTPIVLQRDPTKPPPAPRNLTSQYDILNGTTSLSWLPVRNLANLQGYQVFRKLSGGQALLLSQVPKDQTTFVDHVFSDTSLMVSRTYIYYVNAVNTADQAGAQAWVTVEAIRPDLVKPYFAFVTGNTVVPYGGTVVCSTVVANGQSVPNSVSADYQGNGSWVAMTPLSNGVFRSTFTTGTSSAWGNVRLKLSYGSDSVIKTFRVRVQPQAVDLFKTDSIATGVTLRWKRSRDSDFGSYAVQLLAPGATVGTVVKRTFDKSDTSFPITTQQANIVGYYSVVVTDTEMLSAQGNGVNVGAFNSAPYFTTDTLEIDTVVSANSEYRITVQALDADNDQIVYEVPRPYSDSGMKMDNNTFVWIPSLKNLGPHRCKVVARDNRGGFDTLAWTVHVEAHDVWDTASPMPVARRGYGCAVVGGKIYVFGGKCIKGGLSGTKESAVATMDVYDPLTRQWTQSKALLDTARFAPLVAVSNGKIYAFGGESDRGTLLSTMAVYDTLTKSWTHLPVKAPFARSSGAACIIGDNFYCIGGIGGIVFDPLVNPLPEQLAVNSVDVFNIKTQLWNKSTTKLQFARNGHQAVVYNGRIYVFGGEGGPKDSVPESSQTVTSSVESFDPTGPTASAPYTYYLWNPRTCFASATVGDLVFILGGLNQTMDQTLGSLETFNLATGEHITLLLPFSMYGFQAANVNGMVYCLGGIDRVAQSATPTTRVMVYYP
jgi:N-acetylneuraminic acid mutarotase